MSNIYTSADQLIGKTPLLELTHIEKAHDLKAKIVAKLEYFNPAGSVKDRLGEYFIKDAEERGELKKGSTIIEATAGNTGLGIAFAALNKGYRVIFVVPTKFSVEKQTLMRALGAELINTPRELGMKGATDKANELLAAIPGSVSFRQFENPANPMAHYLMTGPEIYEDMDGKIDYFVAGAGTGGLPCAHSTVPLPTWIGETMTCSGASSSISRQTAVTSATASMEPTSWKWI